MKSFIIFGELAKRESFIEKFISGEKILPYNIIRYNDRLGIEDARRLRLVFSRKHPDKRLIVISEELGIEAQNSLLKTFEEHSENVSIIISTERLDNILETVRSRFFVLGFNNSRSVEEPRDKDFGDLFGSDAGGRLLLVDRFIKSYEKESPQKLVDKFILLYRSFLLKNIKKLSGDDVIDQVRLLRSLEKTSRLVKNNNLNLRLALENALLRPF